MDVMGLTYMRRKAVTGSSVASSCRQARLYCHPVPGSLWGLSGSGSLDSPEAGKRPRQALQPVLYPRSGRFYTAAKAKFWLTAGN